MALEKPKVFIAETTTTVIVAEIQQLGWGRMWSFRRPRALGDTELWAYDNGAYRYWRSGESFDATAYLDRTQHAGAAVDSAPYLAVLPDQVAAGRVSLDFSLHWLDRLASEYDWPWYLAVQDGMVCSDIPEDLPIAGIFLGGTDAYKNQAYTWVRWAHERDLLFHYARCGTPRKLGIAARLGVDSIDSALPLWSRAMWRTYVNCWENIVPGVRVVSLFDRIGCGPATV